MGSVQFQAAPGSPLKSVTPQNDLSSDSELSDLEVDANPRVNGLHLPVVGVDSDEELEASDDESAVESLIQDVFEDMGYDALLHGEPGTCSLEEAGHYRQLLRAVGPEEFCNQTVYAEKISAKKLCTAFGVRPPAFLDGQPDESYYSLLSLAISRELTKRIKLRQYNTIDDAVNLITKSQNIIVITGAGISTSLGIPDFRSKDIGLYAQLAHLGLQDPQEVFDIKLFRNDPTIFFSVAKDILPATDRFTPTHAFIHLLQQKGKLLTNYSQNIDNIEAAAGILPEKLIQCHGSFATATCMECRYQVPCEDIYHDIKAGNIPYCQQCTNRLQAEKRPRKRKRTKNGQEKKRRRTAGGDSSDDDETYDIPQAGVMKPDITFFGEALPDHFSERLTRHDKDIVDLVIVIGTSLKVAPVSEVVPYLPAHVPQMYISMQPVSHVNFDIDLLGECDVVIAELCRRAGWKLNHPMEADTKLLDIKLADGFPSRHIFTSVKTKNLV